MQAPLPDGVTRSKDISTNITLDNCHALLFETAPEGEAVSSCVIDWNDGPRYTKPMEKGKRLRDLRAGDLIEHNGKRLLITAVELYR